MQKTLLSASVLALFMAAPSMAVAASHDAKTDPTAMRKDRNIKGDGIEVVAVPKADMPKSPGLEISGGTSFNAYAFNQLVKGQKGRGTHFGADDSRINFEVLGKTGPELGCVEYSFLIGMTGNTEAGTTSVEENRVKLKSAYGTFIGGVHRGVTDFMSVGAFTFHNGTGNVLGNYTKIISQTTGAVIKDDPAGHGKDRTKLTLITPRFMFGEFGGIQFGYSYTPDGEHRGEAKLNTLVNNSSKFEAAGQNLHEFAVNFKGEAANGFGAQLSFTGLIGAAKQLSSNAALGNGVAANVYGARQFEDIRSYAIGLVLSYAGFSVGGEYLNNGRSLSLRGFQMGGGAGNPANEYAVSGADAGRMYNFGVGYTTGKHSVSLGYLKSHRCLGTAVDVNNVNNPIAFGTVDSKVASVSYDYKVAKGLKVYAEATHFDMKHNGDPGNLAIYNQAATGSSTIVDSNSGRAFIAGIAVSF